MLSERRYPEGRPPSRSRIPGQSGASVFGSSLSTGVIRDVVDSMDLWSLCPRNRFPDRRRGDAELPRRLCQGEPEARHEVDRQLGPHGSDPVPAASHLELRQADLGLAAAAANERLRLAQPVRPSLLRLLPRIPGGQHPLDERPAPQDARVR